MEMNYLKEVSHSTQVLLVFVAVITDARTNNVICMQIIAHNSYTTPIEILFEADKPKKNKSNCSNQSAEAKKKSGRLLSNNYYTKSLEILCNCYQFQNIIPLIENL